MAKKQADAVYKIVEVVGVSDKSWEDAGRSAVETAAGSLRDLRVAESNANGHEVGKRQGRRISHPRVALLQIRSLRGFADSPAAAWTERRLTIAREVGRHPLLAVAGGGRSRDRGTLLAEEC